MFAGQTCQIFCRNFAAFGQLHRTAVGFLTNDHTLNTVECIVIKNTQLVSQVLTVTFQLGINNGLSTFVALDTFASKDLNVDNRTAHASRHTQRGVFYVGCFFAKDGAQQFLFRSQLGFAFRRYFTYQHITCFHFRTDVNDTGFIQTVLHTLGQVRNIAGNIFRTQLGVAGNNIQFLNVNRSIAVVCSHFFGNQNRVFIVITVPRHEGDGHVLTQSQFAQIGGCAVSNQIAALQNVASFDGRTLVDIGRLVGTGEFNQVVNIDTHFTGSRFIVMDTNHNTVGINILNHTAAAGNDCSSRVNSNGTFDTGTNHRFFRTQARYGLTLHVGTHQCTVRIIVFQERNQGCRYGYHLTGCHVHILHTVRRCHNGFAFFATSYQVANQITVFVQISIRLCNHITAFFNGRQVIDFLGYFAVDNAAVRSFQETIIIGTRINGQ